MKKNIKISVVGTVGVPAIYGGFETLVENLIKNQSLISTNNTLTVYCSGNSYPVRKATYLSAQLRYIPLNANGVQSILYDIISLLSAIWHRSDVVLLLGVSGAIALPFIRLISSARIVTNIDGMEWRRQKWQGLTKYFLRFSEKLAVHFSHEVISDNDAIANYVKHTYGVDSHVVSYGGDHALAADARPLPTGEWPKDYVFTVCRIEPENNVHLICESFSDIQTPALVIVGNWNSSEYGRSLRTKYKACKNIYLLDPIYDLGVLKTLRAGAFFYIHGHSAGGTNPSLVEAMHFGKAVLAFDCSFNRSTTEEKAIYFKNSDQLQASIKNLDSTTMKTVGNDMLDIARRRYTWSVVASQYFSLLCKGQA
jgi:glycosyltransferase involved in cell wall biosynthesis